jgi:hypothetical protein
MREIFDFPGNNEVKEEMDPMIQIESASSFEELESVLDSIGPIKGSQEVYSADQLIDIIRRVREGSLHINNVTSTHGLRIKVSSLLELGVVQTEKSSENKQNSVDEMRRYEMYGQIFSDPSVKNLIDLLVQKFIRPSDRSHGDLQWYEIEALLENRAKTPHDFKNELVRQLLREKYVRVEELQKQTNFNDENKSAAESSLKKIQGYLKDGTVERAMEILYGSKGTEMSVSGEGSIDSRDSGEKIRTPYEEYVKNLNRQFGGIIANLEVKSLIDSLVGKFVRGIRGRTYDGGLQIFEFEGLLRLADNKEKFLELCQKYAADSFNKVQSVDESVKYGKEIAEYSLARARVDLKSSTVKKAIEIIYN